jgi:hypothetical protein
MTQREFRDFLPEMLNLVAWVDARKPNNFLEYFHNLCWVSPFEPIGNT